MKAREVKLLATTSARGAGTLGDPCRTVLELWTPDGQLVALFDPAEDEDCRSHPEIADLFR